MKRKFYTSPKASKLKLFFWKAAGGDRELLERSTYSDQIKYMCLGGIIVATGVMAGIAGGYAFYTIFQPRGSALDGIITADGPHTEVIISSIVFGCLWGLMIFNLDRFIVSSTGVGDGTEAITWSELKGAIPRLILGAIIAITISKPVEIRMFKSEIDGVLHSKQMQKIIEDDGLVDTIVQPKIDEIEREIAMIDSNRSIEEGKLGSKLDRLYNDKNEKETQLKAARMAWEDQLQGRAGAPPGDGKRAKKLEAMYKKIENELDEIEDKIEIQKSLNDSDLSNWDSRVEARLNELTADRDSLEAFGEKLGEDNKTVANGFDGLLERIKIAHEIAGFWISLFITLLFMAIELTPIFFKLMLIKSPYDFMKHNVEELLIAEQGIQIHRNYHKDKQGQELDWIQHHHRDRIILDLEKITKEKISLLNAQTELTDYAISKYKEDMKKKIDANPQAYIKTDESSTGADNEA